MKHTLLTVLLFIPLLLLSQESQLQVIKNGKVRKRIEPGTMVKLTDRQGNVYIGPFGILNDSFIVIGDVPLRPDDMAELQFFRPKKRNEFNWEKFAYTTMAVVLSTAGMTLSKWEKLPTAIIYSSVIGYSPYLINAIKSNISFRKKKFRFRKNTRLRIWSIERYQVPRPF